MTDKTIQGKKGLDLLEEAVFLLRRVPAAAWLCYYSSALPFIVGLLWFWADMSCNPLAPEYSSAAALGLALLFIWLKCGQALFSSHVMAYLMEDKRPRWRARSIFRLILRQAAWAPTGLIILPLGLLVAIPFGWIFAFYQNLTLLEQPQDQNGKDLYKRARQQALLWPKQNHMVILILILINIIVFINILTVFAWGPGLLRSITGVETVFSRSIFSYTNSTFYMVCAAITFLIVDPLVKSAYLLRCFYGESIHNGADLRLRLRSYKNIAVTLIMALTICLSSVSAHAATEPVPAEQLDSSLDEVMNQSKYLWRMPKPETKTHKGWLEGWLGDFKRWLDSLNKSAKEREGDHLYSNDSSGGIGLESIMYIIIAGLAAVLLYFIIKNLLQNRKLPAQINQAVEVQATPDLNQEEITADQLPSDGWLGMADELLAKGQYRLALRALFLAQLAQLADKGLIAIAKFKTNRDYECEFARRAHAHSDACHNFRNNRIVFETVWYGNRQTNPNQIEILRRSLFASEGAAP